MVLCNIDILNSTTEIYFFVQHLCYTVTIYYLHTFGIIHIFFHIQPPFGLRQTLHLHVKNIEVIRYTSYRREYVTEKIQLVSLKIMYTSIKQCLCILGKENVIYTLKINKYYRMNINIKILSKKQV